MRYITLSLFIFASTVSFAQGVNIMAEVNYGTYQMTSMKSYLEAKKYNNSVPLSITNKFPGFIGFKVSGTVEAFKSFSTGVFVGFNSTGAKTMYADYSGNTNVVIYCKSISVGLHEEYKIHTKGPYDFNVFALLGVHFNQVHEESSLELYASNYSESRIKRTRSNNLMFNPGFSCMRNWSNFFLRAQISIEVNVANGLESYDGNEITPYGNPLTVQWDGMRIGLAIGKKLGRFSN